MISYLIDINVWLAMTWDLHPRHRSAADWLTAVSITKKDDVELLFCRFTVLGFLRLLTNRAVMGDSATTLQQALEIYDQWHRDPRVTLAQEPRGLETCFRGAARPFLSKFATKAIADCYLAGFAEASGARLVTLDKGLAETAALRKNPVVLIA